MMVSYILCVIGGLWWIVNRRNNARDHLQSQRYLLSKPNLQYDATTMKWTGALYLIGGVIALATGVLGLLGLLPFPR